MDDKVRNSKTYYVQFRAQMCDIRTTAGKDAALLKRPEVALLDLQRLYSQFDPDEREMADQVISEWLLSTDDAERFDGEYLIGELEIKSAIPSLRKLYAMLESSSLSGAPYEQKKIVRLIDKLTKA